MGLRQQLLARRAELGRPVRVGLVGAGQMGRGLIAQVQGIDGMEIVAVADVQPGLAESALRATRSERVVVQGDVDALSEVITDGGHIAVEDSGVLTQLPIDVVIEASGVPAVGAATALHAILAGKHVGLLTIETDVTVGLLLSQLARSAGVVYSVCRGDEPAEAKRLVDYALDLGFEVVCAGKGKNNRLDRTGTPEALADEARRRGMNPKMLTSFVDGTKTMIEMAALSNATGLRVSRRGMHGPTATVDQLANVFVTQAEGGVLEVGGVVDYAMGSVAPGVFCIARSESPLVQQGMAYLSMGAGPNFAFYRPYHLANLEAPLTIGAAVLEHKVDLAPIGWTAEVVATAKRRLHAGELLDGIGGSTVYGVIESADVAVQQGLLPLGLASGVPVSRDIPEGQPLCRADVQPDETALITQLRRLQDSLLPSLLAADSGQGALSSLSAWSASLPARSLQQAS